MTRPKTFAYAGIDVSFAKKKRLPVVVGELQNASLTPLLLKKIPYAKPPRGSGNRGTLDQRVVSRFSKDVLDYFGQIERKENLAIQRIAIDAPRTYKRSNDSRRSAEKAMDGMRISCFTTPSVTEFEAIIAEAIRHLSTGGAENRIPHANQLWMLVGFSLFEVLGKRYECIEVFPQAIATVLKSANDHKSTTIGLQAQLDAIARQTRWPTDAKSQVEFESICYGSRHDKLDAYMSAWIASLSEEERKACGKPPDDVIWIPRIKTETA